MKANYKGKFFSYLSTHISAMHLMLQADKYEKESATAMYFQIRSFKNHQILQ
jgi:hypothetical protein